MDILSNYFPEMLLENMSKSSSFQVPSFIILTIAIIMRIGIGRRSIYLLYTVHMKEVTSENTHIQVCMLTWLMLEVNIECQFSVDTKATLTNFFSTRGTNGSLRSIWFFHKNWTSLLRWNRMKSRKREIVKFDDVSSSIELPYGTCREKKSYRSQFLLFPLSRKSIYASNGFFGKSRGNTGKVGKDIIICVSILMRYNL